MFRGRCIPAELAVLSMELRHGESGVWLNSRGTKSGVVDLVPSDTDAVGSYRTCRVPLPTFVSKTLARMYGAAGVRKGVPDLVIWDAQTNGVRFVEVKCPHWDQTSDEQNLFLLVAKSLGIPASIVEWEFRAAQPGAATGTPKAVRP